MDPQSPEEVVAALRTCLELRQKYVKACVTSGPPRSVNTEHSLECEFHRDGLMRVKDKDGNSVLGPVPSVSDFYRDMDILFHARSAGPVASYCHARLQFTKTKFELFTMFSGEQEVASASDAGHRDFYNVRKVDTHIHHSAAMNAKHLLRFMKKKLKAASHDVVDTDKDGKPRTLGQVFQNMGIEWTKMSLDTLQVWADRSCLHRFDRFNNKYSPMGQNDLRNIFIKTDNPMGGRYLAELTSELLDDLEESKYQHVEWRLSIYGRKLSEWQSLSEWVLGENGKGMAQCSNKKRQALLSPNLRWMIQIPRLFSLYKTSRQLDNFGQMLANIFLPIFEATLHPEAHPQIARFLENISGFDTVDDESKSQRPLDRTFSSKERSPADWNINDNPSYKYYSYFIQTNLRILNQLRHLKGMNQFNFRPHAGEAGEVHHLDTAFLLADGINHGLNLRKSPALQYLFYLAKIGIAMSPCSNNHLFLSYEKSPFPMYFQKGLNVSLSTDDPLMFHQTKEPLMEEYSIAKQLWHFTPADLCEMARNSVLQSGFPREVKAVWLGTKDFESENIPNSTAVPLIRSRFRNQVHREEMAMLNQEVSQAQEANSLVDLLLRSPAASRRKPNFFGEDLIMNPILSSPPKMPGMATEAIGWEEARLERMPLLDLDDDGELMAAQGELEEADASSASAINAVNMTKSQLFGSRSNLTLETLDTLQAITKIITDLPPSDGLARRRSNVLGAPVDREGEAQLNTRLLMLTVGLASLGAAAGSIFAILLAKRFGERS